MTVEYQLLPADLVAFSEEQRRFIPEHPSRIFTYGVLPVLFVGLAVYTDSLLLAAVFAVVYLSTSWLIRHWIERLYHRNAYSEDNLAIQTLPRRVTLSDDGVRFSCEASEFFYRWRFVREIVGGARYVYFIITPLEMMHVPIRAFQDDDHIQKFLQTAQSYVKIQAADRGAGDGGIALRL
jgi:hypothetical protein